MHPILLKRSSTRCNCWNGFAQETREENVTNGVVFFFSRTNFLWKEVCGCLKRTLNVKLHQRSSSLPVQIPTNSGYLRSFLRRTTAIATPSVTAVPRLAVALPRTAPTRVVSMANCMQRQTINDHFQPPLINGMDPDEVQLPDKHIGRDTTSRFASCHLDCLPRRCVDPANRTRF